MDEKVKHELELYLLLLELKLFSQLHWANAEERKRVVKLASEK